MNGRKDFELTMLKAVGLLFGALLCPIVAFGVWLLLTPDYDGGRQGLGRMIVGGAGAVVFAFCAFYFFVRSRMGPSHNNDREPGPG